MDKVLFIDDKFTKLNIKILKELISIVLLKDIEKSYEKETNHLNIALDLRQIEYQILKERLQTITREKKNINLANILNPQTLSNSN